MSSNRDFYEPTPAEIKRECAKIRRENERRMRKGPYHVHEPVSVFVPKVFRVRVSK